MSSSVSLKCRCGKIRGAIDPASSSVGRRVVCMCIDCQTYARWLGDEGEILDEVGGTEAYQTTPARISITEGSEHIRCVRLSPKGTYRFYAGCCRTPLTNQAVPAGMAFAAVVHSFLDFDGRTAEESLGPIRLRVQAKDASGPAPEGSHHTIKKLSLVSLSAGLLWDRVKGEHAPNAFRNDDGGPLVEPEVVSKEERARLKALCGQQ